MKPRVFLVEDEDIIAMLTEEMLEMLGYDVASSAATLAQGLRCAEAEKFDVAVLDVNLRGQESFPIADALALRGIPFIFATGCGRLATEARFPDALVLQKPFLIDVLDEKLKQALGRAGSEGRS